MIDTEIGCVYRDTQSKYWLAVSETMIVSCYDGETKERVLSPNSALTYITNMTTTDLLEVWGIDKDKLDALAKEYIYRDMPAKDEKAKLPKGSGLVVGMLSNHRHRVSNIND